MPTRRLLLEQRPDDLGLVFIDNDRAGLVAPVADREGAEAVWIAINAVQLATYDPDPFILLNLAFSLQAAYAAPLILLAQTRQADRDKANTEADAEHREELSRMNLDLLQKNTQITEQVAQLSRTIDQLTREIHGKLVSEEGGGRA